MHPAIRTQVDGLFEQYSEATAIDCSDRPDMTRQEFRDDADVNKVLQRYGVDGLPRKPVYSEVDYNMDLQQSIEAIREAERAIQKLPDELRSKYGTWEAMFHGAYSGDLPRDLQMYHQKIAEEKAATQGINLAVPTVPPVERGITPTGT